MGTRGLFGFRYRGKYYLIYNHFDSYPEGLGKMIVEEIKQGNLENWMTKLDQIKVIDEKIPPTEEDIKKLAPYTNLNVSNQSTNDWYCLTRRCQGDLQSVLNSGYLLPGVDPNVTEDQLRVEIDNIWIEWTYIIDLDQQQFEVSGHHSTTFNLDQVPENWIDLLT